MTDDGYEAYLVETFGQDVVDEYTALIVEAEVKAANEAEHGHNNHGGGTHGDNGEEDPLAALYAQIDEALASEGLGKSGS